MYEQLAIISDYNGLLFILIHITYNYFMRSLSTNYALSTAHIITIIHILAYIYYI